MCVCVCVCVCMWVGGWVWLGGCFLPNTRTLGCVVLICIVFIFSLSKVAKRATYSLSVWSHKASSDRPGVAMYSRMDWALVAVTRVTTLNTISVFGILILWDPKWQSKHVYIQKPKSSYMQLSRQLSMHTVNTNYTSLTEHVWYKLAIHRYRLTWVWQYAVHGIL